MKLSFFLLLILYMQSCKNDLHRNEDISIITVVDESDPQPLYPDSREVLKLLNLTPGKYQRAIFRYTTISDVTLNPIQTVFFSPSSERDERKRILQFYDSVRSIIKIRLRVNSSSLQRSTCFETIATALRTLVADSCKRGIVLIFSDLQENADLFSVYTPTTRQAILNGTLRIEDVFEASKILPPSLAGTVCIFHYKPKNEDDDRLYAAIVHGYRTVIEKRHGKILIQAQTTYEPELYWK